MPMVVHNKQRIFFRFEGDKGAFLLLHHGLLGSHGDWYESGYVAELSKQFRLIVPDARGHGRSDLPDSAADYHPDELADDIIGILDSLDIRNTHFLGLSLGSLVGFNLLQRYPERIRVTLLGGEVPFVSSAAREVWARYGRTLSSGSLADLRRELMLPDAPPADAESEIVHAAASKALLEAMSGWQDFEAERISVRSPLAMFCGERDPARERIQSAVSRIARVRLIALPGETSIDVFRAKDPLLDLLYRYIRTGRQDQDNRKGSRNSENRKRPQGGRDGGGRHSQDQSSVANEGHGQNRQNAGANEAESQAAVTAAPHQGEPATGSGVDGVRDENNSNRQPSESRQYDPPAPESSSPAGGAVALPPESDAPAGGTESSNPPGGTSAPSDAPAGEAHVERDRADGGQGEPQSAQDREQHNSGDDTATAERSLSGESASPGRANDDPTGASESEPERNRSTWNRDPGDSSSDPKPDSEE